LKLRIFQFLLLAIFFALLIHASLHLPRLGDPNAPMHRELSAAGTPVAGSYYIRHAFRDAGTDNIVTVVLADYRGFDTLGETIVVFTAGVACLLVLIRGRRP
jgi:multicomponent Na+:H+ antiporter subunit B